VFIAVQRKSAFSGIVLTEVVNFTPQEVAIVQICTLVRLKSCSSGGISSSSSSASVVCFGGRLLVFFTL